jgi:hypothetical protein
LDDRRAKLERLVTKEALNERFSGAIGALVEKGAKGFRISAARITAQLIENNELEHSRKVSRYLGQPNTRKADRPQARNAWNLGEALRKLDVEWASGLWVLYASGRFEDFVGVVSLFLLELVQRSKNGDLLTSASRDEIWHMIASVKYLSFSTKFDKSKDIFTLHKSNVCDLHAISNAARSANRELRLEGTELQRATLRLQWREQAKGPWLRYDSYRAVFDNAFIRWTEDRELDVIDEYAYSALIVAKQAIPLWIKESLIRLLLSHLIERAFAPHARFVLPMPIELDVAQNEQLQQGVGLISQAGTISSLDDDLLEEYLSILRSVIIKSE